MELYTVTTPPVEYPVTLAEAKAYMKVTNTAEDDIITALIIAATEQIESYTGQVFVDRTFQGDFAVEYVAYKSEVYPYIKLRRAPLDSVTSVQASISGSFTDIDYQAKKPTHGFTRILITEDSLSLDDVPYPLQVKFVAGYGGASDVPDSIKTAIKMYISFLYKNRGDCVDTNCTVLAGNAGFSPVVKALLAPFRILEVFA